MMVTHTHTHTLSSLADRLLEGAGSSNTHQNTEICTHAGDPQGFSHANVSVILIGRLGNFVDAHTSALSSFPPQAACRVYRDETGSPGERRPCVSVNGPVSLNSHDSDLYGPPDMH